MTPIAGDRPADDRRPAGSLGGAPSRVAVRLREVVIGQRGLRRIALALGAGAASALAMAPFHFAPILLVTLPVLLWLIEGSPTEAAAAAGGGRRSRLLDAARVGWLFGFGYHFAGLYWIGWAFLVEAEKFAVLLPFAVTLMPAGLALFFAAAAALTALAPRRPLVRVLALALALAVAEWLRGHIFTGFPWNILGYALTGPLVLMQAAGIIGVYGLTLLAALGALVPLVVLADALASRRKRLLAVALPVAGLALLVVYGAVRLAAPVPPDVAGHRLRIVQPAIAQTDKWRPDKQREIFERHLALSLVDDAGRPTGLDGITHVVWPEASMPFLPLDSPEALAAIARLLPDGVQLIAGALRVERRPLAGGGTRRLAYNATIVLDSEGRLATLYDKIHLVPFGEYLPFQETLEAIGLEQLSRMKGGFQAGRPPRQSMRIAGLPPIGMLICYEAIFPGAVVQGERPAALFNLTNDGWFGRSTGPYQHLHQSRVRAVEEGLPLVRVANNGVSAVVDPFGRLRATIGLDVAATRDLALPGSIAQPLYARLGDSVFFALALAVAAAIAILIFYARTGRIR